jgi:hypothetical protein
MLATIRLFELDTNKITALCRAAKALTFTSPELSARLFQQALDIAHLLQNHEEKVDAFCALAGVKAFINMESANQLFQQAFDAANLIEDSSNFNAPLPSGSSLTINKKNNMRLHIVNARAMMYCEIAKREASVNPEIANELFRQALSIASLNEFPDPNKGSIFWQIRLFEKIVQIIAETA